MMTMMMTMVTDLRKNTGVSDGESVGGRRRELETDGVQIQIGAGDLGARMKMI